ncbi:hypothetical protein [Sulfurimonas sp. HSL-1716]|uniref:hypothetical protein n=1 Tax=Hydrocurvibacter sulfurireducens TaxID=3131937 RepID=UPI0031F80BC5
MQSAFKWLTPIITIGVAIFIVIFLIDINPSEDMQAVDVKIKNTKIKDEKSEPLWLNHLSKSEKGGFFYPVNEIFVDLDLSEQIVLTKIYQLNASISDPYQFFCLQEVLKQYKMRYYLKKDHLDTKLLIYSEEKSKLDSLVKALKTYDINAKILPYKEEKQWKKVQ